MNFHRKIQITASAVIANGALALGLLTTSVAMACPLLATTCIGSICPAQQIQVNECERLNEGCKVAETQCYLSGSGDDQCIGDGAELYCFYG